MIFRILGPQYSEFPPAFEKASITKNDLSPLMLQFAIDSNLLNQPQKSLMVSMFANKILLTTDLLQWFMDHGPLLTKVYQVVQFKAAACFRKFGESINVIQEGKEIAIKVKRSSQRLQNHRQCGIRYNNNRYGEIL